MKTLLHIKTQKFVDDIPNGFQLFEVWVDDDLFHANPEKGKEVILEMLNEVGNSNTSFYYLTHEFVYSKVIVLNPNEFDKKLNS